MKVKSESEVTQSCLTLSDPIDHSYQAPSSMGFSRQVYWNGVPWPSLDWVLKGVKCLRAAIVSNILESLETYFRDIYFFVFSLPDEKIIYPAPRLLFLEFLKIIYICTIFKTASYVSQSNVTRGLIEPFNELWNHLYLHFLSLEKFRVLHVSVFLRVLSVYVFEVGSSLYNFFFLIYNEFFSLPKKYMGRNFNRQRWEMHIGNSAFVVSKIHIILITLKLLYL